MPKMLRPQGKAAEGVIPRNRGQVALAAAAALSFFPLVALDDGFADVSLDVESVEALLEEVESEVLASDDSLPDPLAPTLALSRLSLR